MVAHTAAPPYGTGEILMEKPISTLNDPSSSLYRERGIGASEQGGATRRHRVLLSHLTSQPFVMHGTHDGGCGFVFNMRGKISVLRIPILPSRGPEDDAYEVEEESALGLAFYIAAHLH